MLFKCQKQYVTFNTSPIQLPIVMIEILYVHTINKFYKNEEKIARNVSQTNLSLKMTLSLIKFNCLCT